MIKKAVAFCLFACLATGIFFASKYFIRKYENDIILQKVVFSSLPEWSNNDFNKIELAFEQSCTKIIESPARDVFLIENHTSNLEILCEKYSEFKKLEPKTYSFKQFIEKNTTPYRIHNLIKNKALFTGYYIPELSGSYKKTDEFKYPVYGKPEANLLNLSRSDIENGALNGKNLEILYVNDDVLLFFAQVQGSFEVKMPDNSKITLGYAGKNLQNYFSIGKFFIDNGIYTKEELSAEKIIEWLKQNPEKKSSTMNLNSSYVFFKKLESKPLTTQQVEVTNEVTLAVDKNFIPLGHMVFLQTNLKKDEQNQPFNKLMIAQDTGGAIKGALRGDIFFGYGEEAFQKASSMKQSGNFYILLPNQ